MSSITSLLLWVAYPVIIFFGLQAIQPRYMAILLGLIMLLRWRQSMHRIKLTLTHLVVIVILLSLMSMTYIANSELLLRIYPAAISLCMLLLFTLSLKYPPSMIEIFARLGTPDLASHAIPYTRKVTQVWCVFFVINGAIALYTALYASRATWSLYNGFIAYIAMGLLYAGEWLVRRRLILRGGNA